MSKVLYVEDLIKPDQLGCRISNYYLDWETARQPKLDQWREVQEYIYATDTTMTANGKLPWSNKTTTPKLCQIRDNLSANYLAAMFPKQKWMQWEGATQSDETVAKRQAIEQYMAWVVDRPEFYEEMSKLVLDFIDFGNCFATVEWTDRRMIASDGSSKVGFVGPTPRRISPLDIVFDPTAPSFVDAPKIIRSIVTLGEIKEILERQSVSEEDAEFAEQLYNYMKELRHNVGNYAGQVDVKDRIFNIAGFDSFQRYLGSNYVEVLTFYGDIYEEETDTFLRNQIIKVVDRHKIITKMVNPSSFGQAPVYHAGWRLRPDNLWAMGPLDNLVGMQYRIDHLENMKADVFDLIAYPPLVIKGQVEDFEWGPMERIYVGDNEGAVEMLNPPVQALAADNQIAILEAKMEEMSGSPKEAMGFRTPGEKTMYEVQRLEAAAGRIFQNKIAHFERQLVEQILNAMLELARRNMSMTTIRTFDEEFDIAVFENLTAEDITGVGRLKPIAARHFAEKATMVQNLNNFFNSAAGQDPAVSVHFSGEKLARLWENLLDVESFQIVEPYVRLTEQADAQRMMNVGQEQVAMEATTPSGLYPDDADMIPGAPGAA
jgi:hypothetical protein